MGRRHHNEFISTTYTTVLPATEDEILEAYSQVAGEDLYLEQIGDLFATLRIPECFTYDIVQCVDYYYEFIKPVPGIKFDPLNVKQYTTINLVKAYTITASLDSLDNIIDIIDIDKLIRNVNRLVKFRDHYSHIVASWRLFVLATTEKQLSDAAVLKHRLSLVDLKTIKTKLHLDTKELGDSLLIDMLSCSTTDVDGNIINFDFTKPKTGTVVSIKDFGEILGNLGELE